MHLAKRQVPFRSWVSTKLGYVKNSIFRGITFSSHYQSMTIYMPKLFQLVPPTKFLWYFLAGNVIRLGLSMVSSMQNRRYVANQQKFHCVMSKETAFLVRIFHVALP